MIFGSVDYYDDSYIIFLLCLIDKIRKNVTYINNSFLPITELTPCPGETMKKEYVTCPMTNFSTIKEILLTLESEHDLKIKTLAEFTKKSVSAINNALPIMRELKLVRTTGRTTGRGNQGKIILLKDGERLVFFLKANDNEKIKEFAQKELLQKSKILLESYEILKDDPEISSEKLGRLLNSKFEKSTKWKLDVTYRNVGRTCMYILEGFQLIEYKGGHGRGRKKFRGKQRNVLLPYMTADKIFDLLRKFKEEGTWHFTNLNQSPSERVRTLGYASTLVDLGITRYIDTKNYILQLTQDGMKLKNTINDRERREIFQDILLKNHHVVEIIRMIKELNREVGYMDVGEIVQKYNDTDWAPLTIRGYGIKILSWLRESDILEKNGEYGKYHISPSFLEKHGMIFVTVAPIEEVRTLVIQEKSSTAIDTDTIFMNLNRYCNWLIYSDNNEWYTNNITKTEIIKNLDQLIGISKGKDSIISKDAKCWIEQGYETKNIKYIRHCLELIVNIDNSNKIST